MDSDWTVEGLEEDARRALAEKTTPEERYRWLMDLLDLLEASGFRVVVDEDGEKRLVRGLEVSQSISPRPGGRGAMG